MQNGTFRLLTLPWGGFLKIQIWGGIYLSISLTFQFYLRLKFAKKKCQRVERTWSRIRRIPSSKLEYFQICCWQPLFVASCQQMFVASRWKAVSANVPTCPSLDLKASKEREGEAIPFYAVIAVFVGDIVSFESKRAKRRSFMQIFV